MSKLKTLVKLLEDTHYSGMCNTMSCSNVNCNQCPFDNEESYEEFQNIVKTWSLVDDD